MNKPHLTHFLDLISNSATQPQAILEASRAITQAELTQLIKAAGPPMPELIAKGLAASEGIARGGIALSPEAAHKMIQEGRPAIFVRHETEPEDMQTFHLAAGIVTSGGGLTSHAAVVARALKKGCIVGCQALQIHHSTRTITVNDHTLQEGEEITINGFTGEIRREAPSDTAAALPARESLQKIVAWSQLQHGLNLTPVVRSESDLAFVSAMASDVMAVALHHEDLSQNSLFLDYVLNPSSSAEHWVTQAFESHCQRLLSQLPSAAPCVKKITIFATALAPGALLHALMTSHDGQHVAHSQERLGHALTRLLALFSEPNRWHALRQSLSEAALKGAHKALGSLRPGWQGEIREYGKSPRALLHTPAEYLNLSSSSHLTNASIDIAAVAHALIGAPFQAKLTSESVHAAFDLIASHPQAQQAMNPPSRLEIWLDSQNLTDDILRHLQAERRFDVWTNASALAEVSLQLARFALTHSLAT